MAKKESKSNDNFSFIERLKKVSNSEFAKTINDFEDFQPRDYISTGNYLFNSLISADPHKGMPSGKIMTLAGPPGCGKSFIMLEILKNAQKMGYTAVLFDSEMANDDFNILKERGLDVENLLYIPIDTVESLKTSLINIIDEIKEGEKIIIGIDSIGNLSTSKELADSKDGSDKKDMTRAAQLKSLFRTITMQSGVKQIPIIAISHTYAAMNSFIPKQEISGGSGPLYMSSIVVQFSKAQEKDSSGTIGAIITAKTEKNRFAKEKSKIKFTINFNTGINSYSGLLTFVEEEKLFIKEGRSYVYNGQKYSPKDLNKEFWEKEINGSLGEYIKNKFKYQSIIEEFEDELEESILLLEK